MMNRVEMKEETMQQVNGGVTFEEFKQAYDNGIHLFCGGHISGRHNPFVMCRCDKCGKEEYTYNSFFPRPSFR